MISMASMQSTPQSTTKSSFFLLLTSLAAALLLVSCGGDHAGTVSEGPGDILVLPAGQAVDLTAEAVPGKVTIYDFHAEWCPPCKLIGPRLEELARERPEEIALRKVDVVSWESDAAVNQGIEYLPYLAIVDASGGVAAEGDPSFDYVKEEFGVDLMAALLVL